MATGASAQDARAARSGADLYSEACASCHGNDGKGAPPSHLGFQEGVPDFSDCEFGPREPDHMWLAIVHGGGPARGFLRLMPSFRDALSVDEIQAVVTHVRTLCTDPSWPRGEMNFPKALVTEKAFPEDELLLTTTATLKGPAQFRERILYEKRFGPLTQIELGLPLQAVKHTAPGGGSTWARGVGDVAVAVKRVLRHDLPRGHIVSATVEAVLPTGDSDKDLGGGTAVIEPFLTYGQRLGGNWFLQAQGAIGIPLKSGHAKEASFRFVTGTSLFPVRFGRMWAPMVEVLGSRELRDGEHVLWDVLPEMQVTLSARQHVRFNAGIRIPVNRTSGRSTQLIAYLLWDWYEGMFWEGW